VWLVASDGGLRGAFGGRPAGWPGGLAPRQRAAEAQAAPQELRDRRRESGETRDP